MLIPLEGTRTLPSPSVLVPALPPPPPPRSPGKSQIEETDVRDILGDQFDPVPDADTGDDSANVQTTAGLPVGMYSVASWNVLSNYWYNFKYYDFFVADYATRWPYRKRLTEQYILRLDADILALQEINPNTYFDDFAFMRNLGYSSILEESGNVWMRCAIFFRNDKFSLVQAEHGAPRCLIAEFKVESKYSFRRADGMTEQRPLFIINCHLSRQDPTFRLVQLQSALNYADEMVKKNGYKVEDIALLLCGDFNTFMYTANSPVRRFLLDGVIEPDFNSKYKVRGVV